MPVSFVSVVLEFVSAMASDSANVGLTIAEATTIAAGSNDQRCSHPGADQCRWPSWCCSVYMPGFPGARHASGGGRSTRQFVQALTGAASAYASAEVANASPLQILE
ncbi:hypothetical protein DIJ64_05075 [Mycobacterium leprae]|uniref:Uncharacterized protein n=2 Tax=Mycobacterium leprae TaxID=1769 RepID=A0AAD0P4Q8_MYCLR|nr:hypothetical protein DIJ64_05075 [Mycobacterium leprae]OAR20726.1 hypothetical protein A8144_09575 [Mycobacterium leprae 3125609]OAX70881.1 hypothetical protein A3216_09200 [Mycobacterium leprae 7935681]